MRGYPQFSFWISITLVQICFSRIFSKRRENTFELVGTVLKDQDSANFVRIQLKYLSLKLQTTVQPLFVSRKIGQDLQECESKPQLVN